MAGHSSVTTSLLGPFVVTDMPAVGMCFLEKTHGDMFVRERSAKSGPYRMYNGGGKSTTIYLCNCKEHSAFPKRSAKKATPSNER